MLQMEATTDYNVKVTLHVFNTGDAQVAWPVEAHVGDTMIACKVYKVRFSAIVGFKEIVLALTDVSI